MGEPEEKLPREILFRAVKSGREYGWRKDDAIQAIEAAKKCRDTQMQPNAGQVMYF